ncbi:MAG: GNAT family N-acetyltransferase [Actinomycetia bacterium]|nr:GNAT family N-acetyltransferase [Actinomycetes bacterium]
MYVNRELVRRVEFGAAAMSARQAEVLARMTPDTPGAAQECDGGQLIAFGAGRYVNRAAGVGLGEMPGSEIVAAVAGFYKARSLPASVEINPWVSADLVTALAAAHFRLERFRNVYVRELASLPTRQVAEIREVDASAVLARNAILAGDSTGDARRINDEFCAVMMQLDDTHDFVALVGDEPAACGSLNVVDDVGWLGGAATLQEFRGRGLQQALLAYRLHLARELKCDFAACTAVPDGQSARNLERLGFQLLYTQTVLTAP